MSVKHRTALRLSQLGVTAVLGFGLAMAVQSAAVAADVTVTPSTGLNDGDTVTVSASALIPNGAYHVLQCGVIASNGEFACDVNSRVDLTADESGALTTPLTVHKTFEGTRGDGSTVIVDCAAVDCLVGLGNEDGSDGGGAPVTFS